MQDIVTGKRIVIGVIALVLFIGINLGVTRYSGLRLDLTEDRLYTLSEGTENILEGLENPVHLTFYYSQKLGQEVPSYGLFAARIRDMLREFQSASGGRLTIDEVNPITFSEAEDAAVEAGMEGIPLDAMGEKIYLGIAGSVDEGDATAVIPFFQPERERFLEYDLAKMVHSLANPERPIVGVVTGTQAFGDFSAMMQGREVTPWAAIAQAQDFFTVEQIFDAKEFLETDPDILVVINPADLSQDMLYVIDQFMLRGGRAAFFLDPWYETAAGGRPGYAPQNSETALKPLFDKWGVDIAEGKVVGDRDLGRVVNAGKDGQSFPAPYIAWLEPKEGNIDQDDAILASIRNLIIPSAGSISLTDGSTLSMHPLITTSGNSALVEAERLREPDIMDLLDGFEPDEAEHVIAARITGAIATAFPDGPPEPVVEEAAGESDPEAEADSDGNEVTAEVDTEVEERPAFLPHLQEANQPINLVLVADSDMLTDRFWVQVSEFFGQRVMVPFGDNGSLLVNALENLNGSGDLISLRSRGTGHRPFTKIEEIRQAAEEQYRAEEQALSRKLAETESKLAELRGGDGEQAITPEAGAESEAALQAFTDDLLQTRKQLRSVNNNLRQDIEKLENRLIFINIAAVPILVAVAAFVLGWIRTSRRRRRSA